MKCELIYIDYNKYKSIRVTYVTHTQLKCNIILIYFIQLHLYYQDFKEE